MKKILLAFAVIAVAVSCDKIKDLLRFDLNAETEFTIPRNSIVPIPDILTPSIQTNFEDAIENNDTRKDLVKEIQLTDFVLTIQGPSQANFDFVESMELSITTDSLPEKLVAWINDVPETGLTTLELITSEDDLDEYIKANSFQLKASITSDKTVSYDTEVKGDMTFSVKADPL